MPFDAEITQKSRDLIVLEKARKWIALSWWHPAHFGHYCAAQAIWAEVDAAETDTAPPRLLGFSDIDEVYAWNDAPGRTKAEVLARFDAAITKASGQ